MFLDLPIHARTDSCDTPKDFVLPVWETLTHDPSDLLVRQDVVVSTLRKRHLVVREETTPHLLNRIPTGFALVNDLTTTIWRVAHFDLSNNTMDDTFFGSHLASGKRYRLRFRVREKLVYIQASEVRDREHLNYLQPTGYIMPDRHPKSKIFPTYETPLFSDLLKRARPEFRF